jgi:TatD DNase family protein
VFVDSHAHLDDPDFDADREAVIERARAAGLRYLLAVGGGTGPQNLESPLPIAERYDWVYATVGIHPHEAGQFQEAHAEQIRKLVSHPKVVAIGEIGLDYYYDHSPREVQRQVLIRQFELAREAGLPVVIHCRDAWADLSEIVRTHWQSSGAAGILHCFTGSLEDARKFLDWGFLVSFAGNLTFKKAEDLRAVARQIPLDHLLTETDCPYLAPVPHRGRRNEPALVREVTRELAELRSLTEEQMGETAVRNFRRFLRLE